MGSFPLHLPPIYYIYCREITPIDSTRVHVHCRCTMQVYTHQCDTGGPVLSIVKECAQAAPGGALCNEASVVC